jgi:hypothetical protein
MLSKESTDIIFLQQDIEEIGKVNGNRKYTSKNEVGVFYYKHYLLIKKWGVF